MRFRGWGEETDLRPRYFRKAIWRGPRLVLSPHPSWLPPLPTQPPLHLAGLTYCALGALTLLGRLHDGISSSDNLTHWLTARQVLLEPKDLLPEGDDDDEEEDSGNGKGAATATAAAQQQQQAEVEISGGGVCAGFNGRCSKRGDTCYSYWVGGSLAVRISIPPPQSFIPPPPP